MASHAGRRMAESESSSDVTVLRRGAKALLSRPGRSGVLLVQERHADGSAFWTLPGGGVRRDESHAAGLRRELVEELGARAKVGDVVARFWYDHTSRPGLVTAYVVFECTPRSPPRSNRSEGILDQLWVDPAAPPRTTLTEVSSVLDEIRG